MGRNIRNKLFDLPPSKCLPNTDSLMPHVFLGDEAFPLLDNLLKPFRRDVATIDKTKKIFNYRLSRARRLVENSFGILAQRFRVFHTPIELSVSTVENLVASACIIHNMMVDERPVSANEDELPTLDGHFALDNVNEIFDEDSLDGCTVRNEFKNYFNGTGVVTWQNNLLGIECMNKNL